MKRAAADTAPVVVDLTGEDEDEEVVERPAQGRQDRRERKRHAAGAAAAAAVEVVELLDDEEPGESEALHECKICFDEVPVSRTVLLSACGHRFCVTCSGMHVKAKILEGQVGDALKCPAVDPKPCGTSIEPADVRRCLGEDDDQALMEKYEEFALRRFVDAHGDDGFACCPTAGCPFVFEWSPEDRKFTCPSCSKVYCLVCKCEWHRGIRCENYEPPPTEEEADEAFQKLVKSKKMKQCPKCKHWVEKTVGCNHISCRCGHHFCYECGESMQTQGGCRCLRELLGSAGHRANLMAHMPQAMAAAAAAGGGAAAAGAQPAAAMGFAAPFWGGAGGGAAFPPFPPAAFAGGVNPGAAAGFAAGLAGAFFPGGMPFNLPPPQPPKQRRRGGRRR